MECFLAVEVPGQVAFPVVHCLSSVAAVEFDWVSDGNGTGGKTERKWTRET